MLQRLKRAFPSHARGSARALLADPTIAAWVDALPLAPGATVVGLGDSITSDRESWLEILRHLLRIRRPGGGVRLVNAGVAGDTSTQALDRVPELLRLRPDWILCAIGTNDARRHGPLSTPCQLTIQETAQNLEALRRLAPTACWVWITPARVIEERIAADGALSNPQRTWRDDDLGTIAVLVRQMPDPVVNLRAAFDRPELGELLQADGLHPSLAGQKAIVTALLERMAGLLP